MLNETESTLRFGLFMLTIMYFRAMVFLRREQRSWGGEDDEVGRKELDGVCYGVCSGMGQRVMREGEVRREWGREGSELGVVRMSGVE